MTESKLLNPRTVIRMVYVAAMFLVAMDATIVNVALLSICEELQISPAAAGTVNIGYLVSVALVLPMAGWLGDRFGGKRMLMIAVTLFTVASVCCGFASSLGELIFFRILQGIGGGLIAPVGMAMLFRAFPPQERANISRSLILPIAVAPAVGPIVSGFFVEQLTWRWCFYINIPIGIIAIILGMIWLKESGKQAVGKLDLPGFLLSAPGFAMLIYALSQGTAHGWRSPEIVITGLTGLIFLAALVFVELRTTQPMLQLRLFADRLYRTTGMIALCTAAGLLGMLYIFPLMYQDVFKASALHTGLTTFPEALGLMAASQLMPWTARKLGPRRIIQIALFCAMVVFALLCLVSADTNPWLVRGLLLSGGLTLGHTVGAIQLLAFARIEPPQMGQAATLFQVQNRLGSALGVALLGSLLAAVSAATADAATVGAASEATSRVAYQAALLGAAGFLAVAWGSSLTLRERDTAGVQYKKPAVPSAPKEKASVSV
jgi:EmrB/QacA subfamily drug resistance transporter